MIYAVGYTALDDELPEFCGPSYDGLKDAQKEADQGNDKYKMLHHKVYEVREVVPNA